MWYVRELDSLESRAPQERGLTYVGCGSGRKEWVLKHSELRAERVVLMLGSGGSCGKVGRGVSGERKGKGEKKAKGLGRGPETRGRSRRTEKLKQPSEVWLSRGTLRLHVKVLY